MPDSEAAVWLSDFTSSSIIERTYVLLSVVVIAPRSRSWRPNVLASGLCVGVTITTRPSSAPRFGLSVMKYAVEVGVIGMCSERPAAVEKYIPNVDIASPIFEGSDMFAVSALENVRFEVIWRG